MPLRLSCSAVVATLLMASTPAHAQDYPTRQIRMLIPYPAGGPADFFARLIAQRIEPILGQPIVIESRSGAVGMLGTDAAAKSAPDGYTILLSGLAPLAVGPYIAKNKLYDTFVHLRPIAMIAKSPQVVSIIPQVGVRTLAELAAYARRNPGKLNYSSSGNGSLPHLAMELLKREARIDIVHVPYRGAAPALNDLLGGHIQMTFGDLSGQLPHIQSGKLVPLAVASPQRTPNLPQVQSTSEAGLPRLLAENWYAVLAPAGVPDPIIRKLHATIAAALQEPGTREALARQSSVPGQEGPEELMAYMRAEHERWVALANAIGVRIE